MDFKAQQERFDAIKWYDSIVAGTDRCGSYEFCKLCCKEEENPCANAAYRYRKGWMRLATVRFKIVDKE
jgi:Zn-dependent alcohol dehydrogenase